MLKRAFDLIVSGTLLAALLPVFAACALVVRIFLGTPVVFRQSRPGLHGRPFEIYKFRTMTDEQDANGQLLPDSDRLTAAGALLRRLSLDELPQLINVFKGDMSLVGPRPLLLEYLPLYSKEQMRRHEVRPGITGWAQVNGRNDLTWPQRFELDLWYIRNQSFFLDLKILALTGLKVIKRQGIASRGHATMPAFRGNGRDVSEQ